MPPPLRLPARLTLTIRPSRCLPPTIKSLSHHRNSSSEPHYDPPGGWLFGVPPGEKYKKEGWENIWMYGFFGSFAVAIVGYIFKPDTSIQTWALEEARRRLEIEGILPDPELEGQKKL